MVDDTHDWMSSSWPHACLPDGTVPGGHSELVFFFFPPFVYVRIKIQVVSGIREGFFRHPPVRILLTVKYYWDWVPGFSSLRLFSFFLFCSLYNLNVTAAGLACKRCRPLRTTQHHLNQFLSLQNQNWMRTVITEFARCTLFHARLVHSIIWSWYHLLQFRKPAAVGWRKRRTKFDHYKKAR